jgi:hypothetical protein
VSCPLHPLRDCHCSPPLLHAPSLPSHSAITWSCSA